MCTARRHPVHHLTAAVPSIFKAGDHRKQTWRRAVSPIIRWPGCCSEPSGADPRNSCPYNPPGGQGRRGREITTIALTSRGTLNGQRVYSRARGGRLQHQIFPYNLAPVPLGPIKEITDSTNFCNKFNGTKRQELRSSMESLPPPAFEVLTFEPRFSGNDN